MFREAALSPSGQLLNLLGVKPSVDVAKKPLLLARNLTDGHGTVGKDELTQITVFVQNFQ